MDTYKADVWLHFVHKDQAEEVFRRIFDIPTYFPPVENQALWIEVNPVNGPEIYSERGRFFTVTYPQVILDPGEERHGDVMLLCALNFNSEDEDEEELLTLIKALRANPEWLYTGTTEVPSNNKH